MTFVTSFTGGSNSANRKQYLTDIVNELNQKSGEANSVLVSQATYEKVRDHVTVRRSFRQKVKGKEQQIMLHFLQSVNYVSGGAKNTLELDAPAG